MPYPSSGLFPSSAVFPGGDPTTAFITPAALVHTREIGGETRFDQPTVRALGSVTVAVLPLIRATAVEHTRAIGVPVAKGRQVLETAALEHVRAMGDIQRVYTNPAPASLVHTRDIGTIEVNLRVLAAPALIRA